jgi:uncharacterized protein with HEPN domain
MKDKRDYVLDILERIRRIEAYTEIGYAAFEESIMAQDAVLRNFELIGEIIRNRLSAEFLAQQPHIAWRDIGDFRNVLIHDYDKVDLEAVWKMVENELPPLKAAVLHLLASLPESDAE